MATQAQAKQALQAMNKSLSEWLRLRKKVDSAVLQGKLDGDNLNRSAKVERKLAEKLYDLLLEAGDAEGIPHYTDPDAAVRLAEYITDPEARVRVHNKNTGLEGWQPWNWGVLLIVGGVVILSITSTIRFLAAQATERERLDCIKARLCEPETGGLGITGYIGIAAVAAGAYWYFVKRKKHA